MAEFKKGIVMVYTGNGKGKTTAAIGLAVRAIGHGLKVFMVQFMKGRDYGEYRAAKNLPGFEIVKSGRDKFVNPSNPEPVDIELAKKGFELAKEAVEGNQYDLVILDEINVAVKFNLIALEEVLHLLENKPEGMSLVLTGRYAAPDIVEKADMVSEVKEIKHHYVKGIAAQKGVEF